MAPLAKYWGGRAPPAHQDRRPWLQKVIKRRDVNEASIVRGRGRGQGHKVEAKTKAEAKCYEAEAECCEAEAVARVD